MQLSCVNIYFFNIQEDEMRIISFIFFFLFVLCPKYGVGQSQVYVFGTAAAEIHVVFPLEIETGKTNSHMHLAPMMLVISENLSEGFSGMGFGMHLEGDAFEISSGVTYDAEEKMVGGFLGFEVSPSAWRLGVESEFASVKDVNFSLSAELQMIEHFGIGSMFQLSVEESISSFGIGPILSFRFSEHMIRSFGLFSRAEVSESKENPLQTSHFHFFHFGIQFEAHFDL